MISHHFFVRNRIGLAFKTHSSVISYPFIQTSGEFPPSPSDQTRHSRGAVTASAATKQKHVTGERKKERLSSELEMDMDMDSDVDKWVKIAWSHVARDRGILEQSDCSGMK